MRELERIVGAPNVERGAVVGDVAVPGTAGVLVRPGSASEVAAVVAWCYAHDVAIVPVGGRSGLAGGAARVAPDVLAVALDRLSAVRSFEPALWRMECEAGVTTATIARRARETGLYFPPDPGAPEQSQLGGTIATNAGGPHAFKYGVTGDWVTGVEAVLAPGELVRVGGPLRKDVAGYDLAALLTGSEGTLGIVTAAWLRLIPAPEAQLTVVATYADAAAGCAALLRVLASGVAPAALEYLDAPATAAAGATSSSTRAVWRWRAGVSHAATTVHGAKLSEDVAVPFEQLEAAIAQTVAIGGRQGLDACSWGHAGDGNVHATFLYDPADGTARARADRAAEELFAMAIELGGTVTGEHGIGILKRGQLARQWAPAAVAAQRAIKHALDPKGLLNPGKKSP